MSERTEAPTEGEPSGDPGTFPAPEDPESPDFVPGERSPDEPGVSDDEATEEEQGAGEDEGGEPSEGAGSEPPSPDTESRMEEVARGLERAAKNYSKRVADVLAGDPMGIVPCPLCSEHFPGLLTPAPPSPEAVAAVRPIIGLPDFTNFRQDGHARICDQCDGLGRTLTGSKVPQYATIQCSECNGTGFRSPLDAHRAQLQNGTAYTPPTPTHEDDVPVPMMPDAALEALEATVNAARAARGMAPG